MKNFQILIIFCVLGFTIQSCISTARLSHFPNDADSLNFEMLSKKDYPKNSDKRTFKFKNGKDYFCDVYEESEADLVNKILTTLYSDNYVPIKVDSTNNRIMAQRGTQAHEWKSIFGIYYKQKAEGFQLYIMNKVTQDITGGHDFNRAELLGSKICASSNR